MRKRTIYLFLVLVCAVSALILILTGCATFDLKDFLGENRETPTRKNLYGNIGTSLGDYYGGTVFGAGYEGAIGNSFSLGFHAGIVKSTYNDAYDDYYDDDYDYYDFNLFLKPRYYFFQSSLEKFFVGANLGLSYNFGRFYFITGLHTGYKFVLGSGQGGLSLEPSIGYDFLPGRFNMGLSLGYAWGGEPKPPIRNGIYVGIIIFGPDAVDITNGPIYLDSDGFARLNNLLDTRYQKGSVPGTALYYAAQLALANMKKAESRLPQLQNVTMFTFTDGIEISSTGGSLLEINDPGNTSGIVFRRSAANVYPDFLRGQVNAQINGRTNTNRRQINGGVVEAYIAAIRGEDVTDLNAFNTGLEVLSTANTSRYRSTGNSFNELESMFRRIAGEIVRTSITSAFSMITPEYRPGTKVRMTFGEGITADRVGNAPQYIEGTVTVRNNEDWLTDIKYNGVSSSAGTEVRGRSERRGTITYEFPNFTGFDINRTKAELDPLLRQWILNQGSSAWQRNTEYNFDPSNMRRVSRNNALVYLVLDCSTSINDNDIPQVRNASKAFIRMLYNAYNQ